MKALYKDDIEGLLVEILTSWPFDKSKHGIFKFDAKILERVGGYRPSTNFDGNFHSQCDDFIYKAETSQTYCFSHFIIGNMGFLKIMYDLQIIGVNSEIVQNLVSMFRPFKSSNGEFYFVDETGVIKTLK